ncbi:hypothetical protein MBLNU230_g7898t1 [Neophaeotheca triangularis]
MDITNTAFYPLLLDMLRDISNSHFVAFDLELSGVPSKQSAFAAQKPGTSPGKPTLQQRYTETKEAAERYQILQIGLTCVQQDKEHNKYICMPYNFNINPVVQERGLDIERIFSFQSGAVEFLLKVGFDIAKPFTKGIPYLSRVEARRARANAARRNDKTAVADIAVKPTETETLAFLERVREEVSAWHRSNGPSAPTYLNIGPGGTSEGQFADSTEELSRFEKRLVHQLVRAEFPDLVTISRRGFIQIVQYDQEREDRIAADRKKEANERINKQKGFRWIIEALLGGDISAIDLKECARDPNTGSPIAADLTTYRRELHAVQSRLRHKATVMVGHNCFLDLVYLYHHFLGPLPEKVEDFQRLIHDYWPIVVDTKYMATHNCGSINPASSLEQIASQLSEEKEPVLELSPNHDAYEKVESFHEAGYDSWLTSQIAVRLSAKLEREGAYIETEGGEEEASGGEEFGQGGVSLNSSSDQKKTASGTQNSIVGGVKNLLSPLTNGWATTAPPQEEEPWVPSAESDRSAWKRKGGDPSIVGAEATIDGPDETPVVPKEFETETIEGGMPKWNSDFWRVYGNRFRVFGTEEGECVFGRIDGDDGGVKGEKKG